MYRIYDKPAAIKRVQQYLSLVSDPSIFVAPSGVYDENTRLSVIYFQNLHGLSPTGVVNYPTFELLYNDYLFITKKEVLSDKLNSFIAFPLLPGHMAEEMMHINRTMGDLLDYYGFTHRLRDSNFYSEESADAVRTLREIYNLKPLELIDEELYLRMINDHNSIGRMRRNF
ncbi:MAG: peptidoglycan-binding protein [Clostridia bacterium]|nr:peptidoglycan-binding protein [Clostridia bacterium]MBR5144076.1 peptidoglycan-binding protein [Clostridia bacterium]